MSRVCWNGGLGWHGQDSGKGGRERSWGLLLTNPVPDPLSKGPQQHRATDICAPILKMRKLSLRRDT